MVNTKKSGNKKSSTSKKETAKKQDTAVYTLRDKNEIVYIGTSNNIEKREKEHQDLGKEFTSIRKESRKMTPESAKKREEEKLENYRKNHKSKNPKYNKDKDG